MKSAAIPSQGTRIAMLVIICGPFASGKNAVIGALMSMGIFKKCVSVTTRPMDPGEVDGVDYFFVTREKFIHMRDVDKVFLETANVHGNLYGTLKESVETKLRDGESVIMHIDMQGVETLIRYGSDIVVSSLLTIYLEVDLPTLVRRAKKRGRAMSKTDFNRRVQSFYQEESRKHVCGHRIPNPDGALEQTVQRIKNIIERRRIEIDYNR